MSLISQNAPTIGLMNSIKLGKQRRSMDVRELKVDKEARTITFPFSSEKPVQRFFGDEVLSHTPSAIDLSRAEAGAMPLLFNHDWDALLGKIESVSMGVDRRLYATAKFAKSKEADDALSLVEQGMLPNVSFGYQVEEFQQTRAADEGIVPEYTATKWSPYEVSLVTVPADFTVGIGRSAEGAEKEIKVINKISTKGKEPTMETKETPAPEAAPKVNIEATRNEGATAERARATAIRALGQKFNQAELANTLIDSGKTLDEAREAFLEKMSTKHETVSESSGKVGLTENEQKQYSWMRAIRALANPTDRKAQEAAAFEFEVSRAGCKLRGKDSEGIHVPQDVLVHSQKRALLKGTPSAGGYLVATEFLPQSFIELLRHKLALGNAGIRTLSGLVGDLAIPKQTGGATAYWVGEAVDVTGSSQTFGQVALAPKTLGAFTDMSRKMIIQSTPDIEGIVVDDLSRVLALALDIAGLYGSGSSAQPLGVANVVGIQTKDITNNAPTFPELVDMESKIAAADADVATMSYIVNAAMRGYMKSTVKFANTANTIWEPGNQVNGYNAITSNQLTSGDVFFGNWNDLVLGLWSGIDLSVDNISLAKQGGLRLIVLQDVDFAVRHAESFCLGQ